MVTTPIDSHQLLRELGYLSPAIASMALTTTVANQPLEGKLKNFGSSGKAIKQIADAVESLISQNGLSISDATDTVTNLVVERHFYGSYCELAAYGWLQRHGADFSAQVQLSHSDVLNPNGCVIDGAFQNCDAFFDIKGFGMQVYLMDLYRKSLQHAVPSLSVIIDGPLDVGAKDIETHAFGGLSALLPTLKEGLHHKIPQLGWTIRIEKPRRVTMATFTDDPYAFAQNNRYYAFKTAKQFTRHKPFVLVFPYASNFNAPLAANVFNTSR